MVTRDVPDRAIVAGNPARVIRIMDSEELKIESARNPNLRRTQTKDIPQNLLAPSEYPFVFGGRLSKLAANAANGGACFRRSPAIPPDARGPRGVRFFLPETHQGDDYGRLRKQVDPDRVDAGLGGAGFHDRSRGNLAGSALIARDMAGGAE